MSLDLYIEIDDRADKSVIVEILKEMNFVTGESDNDSLSGYFPKSEMYSVFRWKSSSEHERVRAEGAEFASAWKIHTRGTFCLYLAKYDQCIIDIKQSIFKLSERSNARLIVSFQFETIYVIRDDDGLRVLDDVLR